MKAIYTFSLILLGFIVTSGTGCNESSNTCSLPNSFENFDQVGLVLLDEDQNFTINEGMLTPESSFIYSAAFYSCDGNVGVFEITLPTAAYFYSGVPAYKWEGFKAADSKGSFYNAEIKGNYVNVSN